MASRLRPAGGRRWPRITSAMNAHAGLARAKVAQGLLTARASSGKDSLWFGYTSSRTGSCSTGALQPRWTMSRRCSTSIPPMPPLPWGGRWRYSGIGLVHQSNSRATPCRAAEPFVCDDRGPIGRGSQLHLKAWKRVAESAENDDDPASKLSAGRGPVAVERQ